MQGSWLEQSNSCPVCRAEAVHDAPPQHQQTGNNDGSAARHARAADDTMQQCTRLLGLFLTICTVGVPVGVLTVSGLRDETGAQVFFNGLYIATVLAFAIIGECVGGGPRGSGPYLMSET